METLKEFRLRWGFGSLWSCLSYICFRLSPKLQVQWSSNGKKRGVSSTKWNEFITHQKAQTKAEFLTYATLRWNMALAAKAKGVTETCSEVVCRTFVSGWAQSFRCSDLQTVKNVAFLRLSGMSLWNKSWVSDICELRWNMALAALRTLGSEVVCPTFVSGWAQSFRCSDLQTVKNVAFLRLSGMSLWNKSWVSDICELRWNMALAALKTLGSEVVCPTFVSGWAQSFRCSDLQTVKNVAFLRLSGMSLSLTKKLKQKLSFWHMRVTLKHGFGSSKDAGLWSCLSYICFRLSPKLQVQWSSNGKKRSVSSTKWNEFITHQKAQTKAEFLTYASYVETWLWQL